MVGFDVELERELAVDGLNELAQMGMEVAKLLRGTGVLVARGTVTSAMLCPARRSAATAD